MSSKAAWDSTLPRVARANSNPTVLEGEIALLEPLLDQEMKQVGDAAGKCSRAAH